MSFDKSNDAESGFLLWFCILYLANFLSITISSQVINGSWHITFVLEADLSPISPLLTSSLSYKSYLIEYSTPSLRSTYSRLMDPQLKSREEASAKIPPSLALLINETRIPYYTSSLKAELSSDFILKRYPSPADFGSISDVSMELC